MASKSKLHKRNKHKGRYDLRELTEVCPELGAFVIPSKDGEESIDFFNPTAVKALNKALLIKHYNIDYWDIPENYLCPPIPGRADYMHFAADLLSQSDFGRAPRGKKVRCLDIGVGANCIYPIIGTAEYEWSFVGSDIDKKAITSAEKIVNENESLKGKIELRHQAKAANIFKGIIETNEKFDITICNPPFHASLAASQAGTLRKLSNLQQKKVTVPTQNFAGQPGELWTDGGEKQFILTMIKQSSAFKRSCLWFTTLVSKQSNLKFFEPALEKLGAKAYKAIPMGTGNKVTRIIAWTFMNLEEEKAWIKERWKN